MINAIISLLLLNFETRFRLKFYIHTWTSGSAMNLCREDKLIARIFQVKMNIQHHILQLQYNHVNLYTNNSVIGI